MTPERWQEINKLFQSALDLDAGERSGFLEKACADDPSLKQQVETLLAANENAGTFISGNAAEDARHLLDPGIDEAMNVGAMGHYEVLSVLGSGGMGKVYLARDPRLNRTIAIKTLPDSYSKHPDYIKRFQTEAKAAATLNHPNVATIHSVEETDDKRYFITMEYVEGTSLAEMMSPTGTDLRTFLNWFVPLSDALAHAHQEGVIHRDIKPSNIMITKSGAPKILDFGLARIDRSRTGEDSTLSLTKTGQVMGTPAYMAPEQAEGKSADTRTDIFSFGVVMYEAITGENPFKGDNYASIVSNLLTKDPVGVGELRKDVPVLVSRLIMKCLEKNPQNRYQSMDEIRVILGEIKSAMGSGASLDRPVQTVKTSQKYLRAVAAAIGVLALSLLLAFTYLLFFATAENEKVGRFNLLFHEGDMFNLTDARISPDGQSVIFVAREDGKRFLRKRPLNSYESSPIRGTEGANDPFFSPDAKWLGYSWQNKEIRKIPVEGGNPVTICSGCKPVSGIDWGTNGTIVFSEKDGISSVDSNGGSPVRITKLNQQKGERSHYEPKYLPNGRDFLFTVDENNVRRTAVYVEASKRWNYVEGAGEGIYPNFVEGKLFFARDENIFAVDFDPLTLKTNGVPKLVLEGVFSFYPKLGIATNGTLLYMPAMPQNDSSLVWLDLNGNEELALPDRKNFNSPRISPDGKRIALTIDGDVWVREFGSTRGVRLSVDGNASYPIWTPDGSAVVYTAERDNTWKIISKSADGSGAETEIFSTDRQIRPNSIHPTDNVIAMGYFPARERGNIAVVDLDTGKMKTIVENQFTNDMPRFSPDGRWLAYFSVESGKTQVFAIPWNREGPRKLITEQTGMYPVWSRDSTTLFSRTPSKSFATPVRVGTDLSAGAEKKLFEGQYRTMFDVSPDGEKLLMVKTERGIFPTYLHVITNWTSELE